MSPGFLPLRNRVDKLLAEVLQWLVSKRSLLDGMDVNRNQSPRKGLLRGGLGGSPEGGGGGPRGVAGGSLGFWGPWPGGALDHSCKILASCPPPSTDQDSAWLLCPTWPASPPSGPGSVK